MRAAKCAGSAGESLFGLKFMRGLCPRATVAAQGDDHRESAVGVEAGELPLRGDQVYLWNFAAACARMDSPRCMRAT